MFMASLTRHFVQAKGVSQRPLEFMGKLIERHTQSSVHKILNVDSLALYCRRIPKRMFHELNLYKSKTIVKYLRNTCMNDVQQVCLRPDEYVGRDEMLIDILHWELTSIQRRVLTHNRGCNSSQDNKIDYKRHLCKHSQRDKTYVQLEKYF